MNPQLFPRPRKRLRQPRKELLRETLASAAQTIIDLRREVVESHDEIRRVYALRLALVVMGVGIGLIIGLLVQATTGVLP